MSLTRIHIAIRGAVQGVGFRPFVYRLAMNSKLTGYVLNNSQGVFIEAEGDELVLKDFLSRIENEKPSLAVIASIEYSFLDSFGYKEFEIRKSEKNENVSAFILPDIAVCGDCLYEMNNPVDRRFNYPFINCTNCGPRFSIIESLPYDRPNTSMKIFEMCDLCKNEYEDPLNRRFHAQPIACPVCGPQLYLWDENGKIVTEKHNALLQAVQLIRDGKIIAIKGLGGFQLIVDAANDSAVAELRKRKHREEKPFALMFTSFEMIESVCKISDEEERSLKSPESPIVLIKKKTITEIPDKYISEFVSPENPYLGAMLPYTPLHHLLMKELNVPVVATSANISEEPICIDNENALARLKGIADYYLINDRPIVRHVDDSIVRIVKGREIMLRRARGYAPLPVLLNKKLEKLSTKNILAVGGHLKNTIALKTGSNIFLSQHIGDLSTEEANRAFKSAINDFENLYACKPELIIHDEHPDYISTKYAAERNENNFSVQHHYAHVAACRLENQVGGDALGVSWDGTGYGTDGTVWGGEFFISRDDGFKHFAQLKQFQLPGGNKAIVEPRRSLAGLLYEIAGNSFNDEYRDILLSLFNKTELSLITEMLVKNLNSPKTSSAGRLFDGVSALLGLCSKSSYEGQAAMQLEFCSDERETGIYNFEVENGDPHIINWKPTILAIISDLKSGKSVSSISARFHNTLSKIILEIAILSGLNKVLLSGGCFQNVVLSERTIDLLQDNNFRVYRHQLVPPNDGGIALGQIAAYLFTSKKQKINKKTIDEVG